MVGCGNRVTKYIHKINTMAADYVNIEAEQQHFW